VLCQTKDVPERFIQKYELVLLYNFMKMRRIEKFS